MRVGALAMAVGVGTVALGGCDLVDPQTGPATVACSDTDSDPANPGSFAMQIRPLMDGSAADPTGHVCLTCHYSTQPSHPCTDITGLDLATLGALRQGG